MVEEKRVWGGSGCRGSHILGTGPGNGKGSIISSIFGRHLEGRGPTAICKGG